MEQNNIKKIVVIGPESTGKSTLCKQLAQQYNTSWCREFAREYLLTNGTSYTFDDLETIAKGQLALEDECVDKLKVQSKKLKVENAFSTHNLQLKIQNSTLLFIDTDMYVMKVWCEYVFGKCHTFILEEIVNRKYDLYLLCNVDLPWVKDELREYPDEKPRQELYRIYKDLLLNQSTPWVEISGNYEQRFEAAVNAINSYI